MAAMVIAGIGAGGLVALAGHDDDDHEGREFRAKLNGYQETPAVFTTGKDGSRRR